MGDGSAVDTRSAPSIINEPFISKGGSIEDKVYVELSERMRKVNAEAEAMHAGR